MTTSFKPYPKYKPSGVEWLGDIPENWETERGKWIFAERKEAKRPDDEQLASTQKYGVIPQKLFMELETQKVVQATAGTDNFTHVEAGDFVISLRSFQGGIEASAHKGCVSPAYTVLAPRDKIQGDYWKHLLKSFSFLQALQTTIEGIRDGKTIKYEQFGMIRFPCPPAGLQESIANFLDSETAKIDETIKELEKSIELLNEEKTSLINEYVTGKINPETGKPYPKYKPSGVEWLGDIPEHWEVDPLFSFGRERKEKNKGMVEENLLSLSYGRIIRKDITSTDGLLPESFETYQIVRKGDIVFRLTDLQNDKRSLRSALVEEDGIITSAYLAIQPRGPSSNFLNYLYRSYDTCKVFYSMGGGLRQSMKYDDMKRLPSLMPPCQEQTVIGNFLDSETAKLNSLISEKQTLIKSLKEYRTSLIHEAVTGKIDLRKV